MLLPNRNLVSLANQMGHGTAPSIIKPAAKELWMSVGHDINDLSIAASIVENLCIFLQPILFDDFGPGSIIKVDATDPNKSIVVTDRVSDTMWGVSHADGSDVDSQEFRITEITTHATTLEELFNNLPSINLVTEDAVLNINMFNGTTGNVDISSSITTDEYHFVNIIAKEQLSHHVDSITSSVYLKMTGIYVKNIFNSGTCNISRSNIATISSSGKIVVTMSMFSSEGNVAAILGAPDSSMFINNTFDDTYNNIFDMSTNNDIELFVNNILGSPTETGTPPVITNGYSNVFIDTGYTGSLGNINNEPFSLYDGKPTTGMFYAISSGYDADGITLPVDYYGNEIKVINKGHYNFIANIKQSVGNPISSTTGTCTIDSAGKVDITLSNMEGNVLDINGTLSLFYMQDTNDNKWYVTSLTGLSPHETSGNYSISRAHNDISTYISSLPVNPAHLNETHTAVVYDTMSAFTISDIVGDATRRIVFKSGVNNVYANDIVIRSSGITVDGFNFNGNGIEVEGGTNVNITNNFFNESDGVVIDKDYNVGGIIGEDANNLIEYNIFNNSIGNAITVYHNPIKNFVLTVNLNDVIVTSYEFNDNYRSFEVVSSVNNVKNAVIWSPGRIELSYYNAEPGMSNFVEYGTKWGDLEVYGYLAPGIYKVSDNTASITVNNDVTSNASYAIYNNTIIGAKNGIYCEFQNHEDSTNVFDVRNNIIEECSELRIFPPTTLSSNINITGNSVDEIEISPYSSGTSYIDIDFIDAAAGDFRLTDIDNYHLSLTGAEVGAIKYNKINKQVFSVGGTTDKKGNATLVVIKDGVAKYKEGLKPAYLLSSASVGDITSTPSGTFVLSGKISQSIWITNGGLPDGTYVVDSILRAFNDVDDINNIDASSFEETHIHLCNDITYTNDLTVSIAGTSQNNKLFIGATGDNKFNSNFDGGIEFDGAVLNIQSPYTTVYGLKSNKSINITATDSVVIKECYVDTNTDGITSVPSANKHSIYSNIVINNGSGTGIIGSDGHVINNTVIGKGSGTGIDADESINCISYGNNVDFIGTTTTCLSEQLKYKEQGNYNLNRYDYKAIRTGTNFTGIFANPILVNYDIHHNRFVNNSDIGASTLGDIKPIDLFYSASNNQVNLSDPSTLTVKDGVVTFEVQQTQHGICAGDLVEHSFGSFKLMKKLTDYNWKVQNEDGTDVDDISIPTGILSIHHANMDIDDAINKFLTVDFPGITSLSKARFNVNILLADDTNHVPTTATIPSIESDGDCHYSIRTPVKWYETNNIQGHFGFLKYTTDTELNQCYNIQISNDNGVGITVDANFVTLEGVLIYSSASNCKAIVVNGDNCSINRCNVYKTDSDAISTTGYNTIITNCIIHGVGGYSIKGDGSSTKVSNCTSVYNGKGISNSLYVANCIGLYNSDISYENNVEVLNSISDDSTIEKINGNMTRYNTTFKKLSSLDPSRSILYPIDTMSSNLYYSQGNGTANVIPRTPLASTDVTGILKRRARFDIGAFRYVVKNKYIESVGINLGVDKKTSYNNEDVSIYIRKYGDISIAQFSSPQTHKDLSAGDIMVSGPLKIILAEKIDNRTWVITSESGDPLSVVGNRNINTISTRESIPNIRDKASIYDNFIYNNYSFTSVILKEWYKPVFSLELKITGNSHTTTGYSNCVSIVTSNGKDGLSNSNNRISTRDDSKYYKNFRINISSYDFTNIVGLYLKQSVGEDAVRLLYSDSVIVSSNYIFGTYNNGIDNSLGYNRSLYRINSFINNNRILDASKSGIVMESNSVTTIDEIINTGLIGTCVVNNTLINNVNGIKDSTVYNTHNRLSNKILNNISIGSSDSDILIPKGNSVNNKLISNITSDDSSRMSIGGIRNLQMYSPQFIDVNVDADNKQTLYLKSVIEHKIFSNDTKFLVKEENKAIGSAPSISRDCIPNHMDATGNNREGTRWEHGALTHIVISGVGSLLCPYPTMLSDFGWVGEDNSSTHLYLRREDPSNLGTIESGHMLPSVDTSVQFPNTELLNAWIDDDINDVNLIRNLFIHVEGGQYFEGTVLPNGDSGTFELGDRLNKRVYIDTMVNERHLGAGTIIYNTSLISKDSYQSSVNIEAINLYSSDTTGPHFIMDINNTSQCKVNFINSTVQVTGDYIVSNTGFEVNVINTAVVYKDTSNTLYLSNTDGSKSLNSIILLNKPSSVIFDTSPSAPILSRVDNTLAYNYNEAGDITILDVLPGDYVIENIDPGFKSFALPNGFIQEFVMNLGFDINSTSILIDKGDNTYINGFDFDINGGARVFLNRTVDIGPIEAHVYQISIGIDKIFSIEQKKLYTNHNNDSLQSTDLDKTYYDAYNKFESIDIANEFVRESNILIELKSYIGDHVVGTDKGEKLLVSMPAILDEPTRTIITKKDRGYNSKFLATAFKDGRYTFFFDEVKSILNIYINDTYNKGVSGKKNVVNNVRFSGTRMVNN